MCIWNAVSLIFKSPNYELVIKFPCCIADTTFHLHICSKICKFKTLLAAFYCHWLRFVNYGWHCHKINFWKLDMPLLHHLRMNPIRWTFVLIGSAYIIVNVILVYIVMRLRPCQLNFMFLNSGRADFFYRVGWYFYFLFYFYFFSWARTGVGGTPFGCGTMILMGINT